MHSKPSSVLFCSCNIRLFFSFPLISSRGPWLSRHYSHPLYLLTLLNNGYYKQTRFNMVSLVGIKYIWYCNWTVILLTEHSFPLTQVEIGCCYLPICATPCEQDLQIGNQKMLVRCDHRFVRPKGLPKGCFGLDLKLRSSSKQEDTVPLPACFISSAAAVRTFSRSFEMPCFHIS